jgi:hypothetical protein
MEPISWKECTTLYAQISRSRRPEEVLKKWKVSLNSLKLHSCSFLLTFAANLFSMQIQELQYNPPASYFIATAIDFMSIAYAIRLAVRSSAIKLYKRHVFTLIEWGTFQHTPISCLADLCIAIFDLGNCGLHNLPLFQTCHHCSCLFSAHGSSSCPVAAGIQHRIYRHDHAGFLTNGSDASLGFESCCLKRRLEK